MPPRQEGQRKRTGDQWQSQLIRTIWKEWETRWSDRNQAVHEKNAITRQQALRREVTRQLNQIYQQHHLMEPPSVQELLHNSPEEHQDQQLHTTRNWLAQHTTLFKESVRRVKKKAIQGVRSIRSFFWGMKSTGICNRLLLPSPRVVAVRVRPDFHI